MIWSDFVTEVKAQLSVDANRRGLTTFNDRFMRNAILDLQRFIVGYRQGNTTTFALADVTQLGQASLIQMPAGALPKEIYLVDVDTSEEAANPRCTRYRLDYYPWASRQDLICGNLNFLNWWNGGWWTDGVCPAPPADCTDWSCLSSKRYVYAIAPHGKNFIVYPQVSSILSCLLVWDGYKTEFANGDIVPFPAGASEAVANYVKWRIALEVDKNIPLSREFKGAWMEKRLALYRDFQDGLDIEGEGDEYDTTAQPVDTNIKSGTAALAAAATSQAVVFGAAFTRAPIVDCWITDPDGAISQINAFANPTTITVNGFTALFTGAIPAAGYTLNWSASTTN